MLQENTPERLPSKPKPTTWLELIAGGVARRWLALRYRVLSRRYGRLVLEDIDGVAFLVMPEVFNPVLLRSGAFMARSLARLSLEPARDWRQLSVLDLGAGAGVGAVFAARRGARVKGVDINPAAVRCARINALLNRLEDRIQVFEGDLFAPVKGERFDLILFNPPFYRGQPRHALDHAWRGVDVFERFAAQLGQMLNPGGGCLLVLSSDGDGDELLSLLDESGFAIDIVAQKNLINERLTMYRVRSRQ